MKIETISVKTFRYPVSLMEDSDGHMHPGPERDAKAALCTISTDTGLSGQIIIGALALPHHVLERFIRPNLIGEDPLANERIWYGIYKWQRLSGGLLTDRALAAVDLALWDLKGKAAGMPVWKMLGGYRDRIPAYGSTMCGDNLENGLAIPEDYARFAEWMVNERGYRAVKLHGWMPPMPGAPDPRKDIAAASAVREAVGPGVDLMFDPHHMYTRSDALWLAQKLKELDFLWLEEPMEEASMSSYIWLRERSGLSLAGPETMTGKHWTRAEWIRYGACDHVRTGVMDVGGITPSMKVASLAECHHMSCEVHGTGAGNLAVACAIPNTRYYERGLLHPFVDYDVPKPYQNRIDDEMDSQGYVHPRPEPGLGQDLNLEYIEANLV